MERYTHSHDGIKMASTFQVWTLVFSLVFAFNSQAKSDPQPAVNQSFDNRIIEDFSYLMIHFQQLMSVYQFCLDLEQDLTSQQQAQQSQVSGNFFDNEGFRVNLHRVKGLDLSKLSGDCSSFVKHMNLANIQDKVSIFLNSYKKGESIIEEVRALNDRSFFEKLWDNFTAVPIALYSTAVEFIEELEQKQAPPQDNVAYAQIPMPTGILTYLLGAAGALAAFEAAVVTTVIYSSVVLMHTLIDQSHSDLFFADFPSKGLEFTSVFEDALEDLGDITIGFTNTFPNHILWPEYTLAAGINQTVADLMVESWMGNGEITIRIEESLEAMGKSLNDNLLDPRHRACDVKFMVYMLTIAKQKGLSKNQMNSVIDSLFTHQFTSVPVLSVFTNTYHDMKGFYCLGVCLYQGYWPENACPSPSTK